MSKRLLFTQLMKYDREFYTELSIILDSKNARQIIWHECNETITIPLCPICNTNRLAWH